MAKKSKKKLGSDAAQEEMPIKGKGVEKLHIPSIEAAAKKYVKARDERITYSEVEDDAYKVLLEEVKAHRGELIQEVGGGVSYRYGDNLVKLCPPKAEKLTVKSVHDANPNEQEG